MAAKLLHVWRPDVTNLLQSPCTDLAQVGGRRRQSLLHIWNQGNSFGARPLQSLTHFTRVNHASYGPAVQKSNSKLVISRPESDSEVTQLGIGVGGPSSPWGLPGSNESWISLQSDSDWIEISFHLKFVLACTWGSTSPSTCWASTLHNSMLLQTQANVKQQPDSV